MSFGIGGGDSDRFDAWFRGFARREYNIGDAEIQLVDGFHGVEHGEDGGTWVWMGSTARMAIPAQTADRFVAIHIFPRSPNPELNLGRFRHNGGQWEYFETSSDVLYLPAKAGLRGGSHCCEIEVLETYQVGEDSRALGLGISGISVLSTPCAAPGTA